MSGTWDVFTGSPAVPPGVLTELTALQTVLPGYKVNITSEAPGCLVGDAELGAERVPGDGPPVLPLVVGGGAAGRREHGLVLPVLCRGRPSPARAGHWCRRPGWGRRRRAGHGAARRSALASSLAPRIDGFHHMLMCSAALPPGAVEGARLPAQNRGGFVPDRAWGLSRAAGPGGWAGRLLAGLSEVCRLAR